MWEERRNFILQESALLRDLRVKNIAALKIRLFQLLEAGHSAADIWRIYCLEQPDVSYTTIREQIAEGERLSKTHYLPTLRPPATSVYPRKLLDSPRTHTTRVWVQIPEDEKLPFAILANRVSGLRGTTAPDDPRWETRRFYEQALMTYYRRGVRIADLARAAGVTHRAITLRIQRVQAEAEQTAATGK